MAPQRRDPSSASSDEDAPSKEEAEVSKDHGISTPLPKKPAAKKQPQIPPPSKSATKHGSAKRKASDIEVETAKEKKDVKKGLLFTEGDDIVILEGMIEYRSKTGLQPRSNIKGFIEFVNKSLSFGATQTQLYEKVRRLQKKYEKNAIGENPGVFVKPHEEKVFELSKKIWENNDGGNGLGNESESKKKVELEGKWEQLMIDETEHYLKKLDLIREQMMLVLEAMELYGA